MKHFHIISPFKAVLVFCFLACALTAAGEAAPAKSNRTATSNLQKAELSYRALQFAVAAEYYENYLKNITSVKPEVLRNLADCYWQMRNYPKAYKVYKLLYPKGKSSASEIEQFRIGELYARFGDYKAAFRWLDNLPSFTGKSTAYSTGKIKDMKVDSTTWKIGNLNINTIYREFSPYLIDSTLLFSSNRPLNIRKKASSWDGESYSRLWQTLVSQIMIVGDSQSKEKIAAAKALREKEIKRKNLAGVYVGSDNQVSDKVLVSRIGLAYTKAAGNYIGKPIKGLSKLAYNTGAVSVDKDGTMYFSANYVRSDKKGINRVRIMEGHYTGDGLEKILPMPFGDPNAYSVMHPTVNMAGTLIIFSSNKPGGAGQFDLYYSKRESKQQPWSEPVMLGGKINSPGNEVFPSITSDGYLYYSSDGKEGLGGLDIYRIKLDDALAGTGMSEHLGYPVNSASDDFGWTQSRDGKQIYFTSDRETSEDNIYSAQYNEEAAKKAIIAKQTKQLEGFVFDRQTMVPIKDATVFLLNKCNNKIYVTSTNAQGKYSYPMPLHCELEILGACKGYTQDCMKVTADAFKATDDVVQRAPRDLLLDRYSRNFTWKLGNIHYDFDKYNIRPDARPTLDSLVDILKQYPIKVELGSHTDSRGSFAYNDRLSQRRADAAVEYIVAHGVDRNRITAKGYGEHHLLNKCSDGVPCSEAMHQENRRTEIKVIIGQEADMPDGFDPAVYNTGKPLDIDQLPANFFDKCK